MRAGLESSSVCLTLSLGCAFRPATVIIVLILEDFQIDNPDNTDGDRGRPGERGARINEGGLGKKTKQWPMLLLLPDEWICEV